MIASPGHCRGPALTAIVPVIPAGACAGSEPAGTVVAPTPETVALVREATGVEPELT